jgi:protein gp37
MESCSMQQQRSQNSGCLFTHHPRNARSDDVSDNTKIEWTDATWNPITGCSVVSAGCKHCYAMKLAGTRLRTHPSRVGLTRDTAAGPVWNGKVRFNGEWLDQPLRWKRPRRIFVCAHGDLFHESVPDEWIDRVLGIMALAKQHTFQVLTKRVARMHDYLIDVQVRNGIGGADYPEDTPIPKFFHFPLPNVWFGVSAENQETADERIPHLLQCPAAVRFVSAEPLLGQIDLRQACAGHRWRDSDGVECCGVTRNLDWVIAGGESGVGARPMHPAWARSLRDQCRNANVPFFFKQWGEFASVSEVDGTGAHHSFADGATVRRVGKKRAGRLLDGVEHNGMPV